MKKPTIAERFNEFHSKNPHIYESLVELAKKVRSRRNDCVIGICLLYEVLRWNSLIKTDSDDTFKLCNSYKPFYARKIMENETDLKGLFRIKSSVADRMDDEDSVEIFY